MISRQTEKNARNLLLWVSLALFIRCICMLIAVHGDTAYINYYPSKLVHEGTFDVYRYISLHENNPLWTYYPPLTYFIIGFFQLVFKFFDNGFYHWIHGLNLIGFRQYLISNGVSFDFLKWLFFMKLPYVIFDLLLLLFIFKYFSESQGNKARALRLWALNPVIIYGTYMMGQMDIIPTSMALLSLLFLRKRNMYLSFFILSVAALFKTFTILMILPFMVISVDSKKGALKGLSIVAATFMLAIIPYYFSSGTLILNALFPTYSSENVGLAGTTCQILQKAIFAALYIGILVRCFKYRKKEDENKFVTTAISVLMLTYVQFFTPVHYFIWVIPFLIIAVCDGILPAYLFWAQIVCLFLYNLNSANTTTWMLMPLNPTFFGNLPGLPDIMHRFYIPWGAVMLLARLVFTVVCVLIISDLMWQTSFIKKSLTGRTKK